MSSHKFRKLNIDLPRQQLVDQRPFMIAGITIAFLILLMFVCAYIANAKKQMSIQQQTEMVKRIKS